MTYQEVVNLIRTVATTVNATGTFVHGVKLFGSTKSIDGPDPVIVLLPFTTSRPNDSVGYTTDHKIQMTFWQQDKPDSSALEQEAIIAAMDVLSRTFELELERVADLPANITAGVNIINVEKEPDYRRLMSTMSGYLLQFTLKSGIDVC